MGVSNKDNKGIKMFYTDNGPFYGNIDGFIRHVKMSGLPIIKKKHRGEWYEIYNVPCAFDTETTSYLTEDNDKVAWVYIWMFGINGISVYGRTEEEFLYLMQRLHDELDLSFYKRLYCYVHNLSFDFQFIRKWMKWNEVFARSSHSPMYAVCEYGIEFRDSYILTGEGLAATGEKLTRYKASKAVDDLNYDLVRGPKTKLTDIEMGYCVNDVRVIMCHIMEQIENEGGKITRIPLTKTGYVRRTVKNNVLKDRVANKKVHDLRITEEEYEMCKRAFQGGFTHANIMHSCETLQNVTSYDFTSSYPTVCLTYSFPCSCGEKYDPKDSEDFLKTLEQYCCMFDIEMTNVKIRPGMGDCPISSSKCIECENAIIDNGRVRKADKILTTIIESDFLTYSKFYTFDYRIGRLYRYRRGYLPKPYIETILEYYKNKTALKNVDGMETEYGRSKADLNALYGMMCTSIYDEFVYDYVEHWWDPVKNEFCCADALEQYNSSKGRFSFYLWSLWVTGIARLNLFSGIYACGDDYVYSDTDSIKLLNAEEHKEYFENYNRNIVAELEDTMEFFGFDKDRIRPKTVEGIEKPLGVWDYEGTYDKFKTLHSKCYIVEHDGDLKCTVAGIKKDVLKKALIKEHNKTGKDVFDLFEDGFKVEAKDTKKQTHFYQEAPYTVEFTDYTGKTDTITTLSGVHLAPEDFQIGVTDAYRLLLIMLGRGMYSDTAVG